MKETERNEWERKVFHAAIDDTLSGLQGDPWLFRRVISETQKKGSEKMIKKMSVGLVLTILLILLTMGTAVALMTMREVGQEIAAFEQEDGAFTDWPAESDCGYPSYGTGVYPRNRSAAKNGGRQTYGG